MEILDRILALSLELSEQQVDVDDAEGMAKQARQAANRIYAFMRSCEAMIPVSDDEILSAVRDFGVKELLDRNVLQVNNANYRRWKS